MQRPLNILWVAALLSLIGCVRALRPYNAPSQQKLQLQTAQPTNCVVRVAGTNDYPAAADGRVEFEVPRLPRGCDVRLFGLVKIQDGSPENLRAIQVLCNGKTVRKLSLTELGDLPVDSTGYHILTLK